MPEQQDLIASSVRNLRERIKAIIDGGDGYMTVMTKKETEQFLGGGKNNADIRNADRNKKGKIL